MKNPADTDVRPSMTKLSLVLGVILTLASLAAYFAPMIGLPSRVAAVEQQLAPLNILPPRLSALEQRQAAVEAARTADRELLIRIDENVQALKSAHQVKP